MRRETSEFRTEFTVDGLQAIATAARALPPTGQDFVDAILGPDGQDCRDLSGLGWLRDLLRAARNSGAFEALNGDSDDPDATGLMLRSVDDLYRRLAALTGDRLDIFDSEATASA